MRQRKSLILLGTLVTIALYAEGQFGKALGDTEAATKEVKDKLNKLINDVVSLTDEEPIKQAMDLTHDTAEKITALKFDDQSTNDRPKRAVNSFTVQGNEAAQASVHSRSKRSTPGIPDEFTFTLEALGDHASEPAMIKIGTVVSYKLTIHADAEETDVKVEIFSEISGGPYFMVSNVRISHVGSNLATFDPATKQVKYYSKYNDGRWDYAKLDLGNILNDQTDVNDDSKSKIEILFEVQALKHDGFVVGNTYRVSVGSLYKSESFVTVAQDDLTFENYDPATTPVDATFTISGPDSLTIGTTGVWTIESHLHDLYNDLSVDVLAPLYQADIMQVDRITIESVGENYKYSVSADDVANFTTSSYSAYGNYARLELGTIVNKGYHIADPNGDLDDNKIVFQVAITMLDHTINISSPYTIGFTVWKKDMDAIEIMWSAQQTVQANEDALPALPSSPTFTLATSADTVKAGGRFSVLVNMSLPAASSADYLLEVNGALSGSNALMNLETLRMSRIGHNLPHVPNTKFPDPTFESTVAGAINDFATWDLGVITTTNQRTDYDDYILQVEVAITLEEDVMSHQSEGDELAVLIGVKHATDYYWVGNANITITANNITYGADKVPTFSITNAMGDEGVIYPESAAVIDLDITLPPGVDYMPVTVDIDTQFDASGDNIAKLKIISMDVIHTGDALMLEEDATNPVLSGLALDTDTIDGHDVMSAAQITFTYVTSLRNEDFERYSYNDSTIRVRTVVIARSDVTLVDDTTYWVEMTVNCASDYLYAARTGLQYLADTPDMNTGRDWQPLMTIIPKDWSSETIRPGNAAIYEVTLGVPYRTVGELLVKANSEIAGMIQVCEVTIKSKNSTILDYEPSSYEHDERFFDEVTDHVLTAQNNLPQVSSYGYNWYYDRDHEHMMETHLKYEIIVALLPEADLGSIYSFNNTLQVGHTVVNNLMNLTATDVNIPLLDDGELELPSIYIGHQLENDVMNLGGSELFYLDIYVPPRSQYKYEAVLYAPYDSDYYGQFEMVEAYILTVGENMPCFVIGQSEIVVNTSTGNGGGINNMATLKLGHLINSAEINTTLEVPENLAGQTHSVSATVDIDEGRHIWAGFSEFTLVPESDETNAHPGLVEFEITSDTADTTFTIGEYMNYSAVITIEPNTSYSEFTIITEFPVSVRTGEPLVHLVSWSYDGVTPHLVTSQYPRIANDTNEFTQTTTFTIDLGFVRNTDFNNRSEWINMTSPRDEIYYSFTVRMMDDVTLHDGEVITMLTRILHGSGPVQIDPVNDITATLVAPPEDAPVLTFIAEIVNPPANIYQDTVLDFKLDITLEENSTRFPEDIAVNFKVPHFSEFETAPASDNTYIATETLPTEISSPSGIFFEYDKMRFGALIKADFSMKIDPTEYLKPGMRYRYVNIPVEFTFDLPDKSTSTPMNPEMLRYYLQTIILQFELWIPDCEDALGMESEAIQDCHITASSYESGSEPVNARLNSAGGWATIPKGPPFFGNEYIQVDMGGLTKFTGISIQPHSDDLSNKVLTFHIQYSREGLKWEYAPDNNTDVRVFTVTWSDSPSSSEVQYLTFDEMTFVGRYIRILPQSNSANSYQHKMRFELHGCGHPRGATLPTSYPCPLPEDTSLFSYWQHQLLVLPDLGLMFFCVPPKPTALPYCSGASDYGQKWFAVDDYVMNVLGYDPDNDKLYGLSRSRRHYMRSKDRGFRWYVIDQAEYTAASGSTSFISGEEIASFPLTGMTPSDLYTLYGASGGSKWMSVSNKAVHSFSSDPTSDSSRTADVEQVAFWGDDDWNGP